MMRPTLTTLWLASGGLVATWLAVPPDGVAPVTPATVSVERSASARELAAADLDVQGTKLRQQLGSVPLRTSTRNPFRFGQKSSTPSDDVPRPSAARDASAVSAMPVPQAQPSFSLLGIAERTTPEGSVRTAIISGEEQLYLAMEGDPVGGRYRVVRVESDAAVLRDEGGSEMRLVLK